jgi:hypothetical protein
MGSEKGNLLERILRLMNRKSLSSSDEKQSADSLEFDLASGNRFAGGRSGAELVST